MQNIKIKNILFILLVCAMAMICSNTVFADIELESIKIEGKLFRTIYANPFS